MDNNIHEDLTKLVEKICTDNKKTRRLQIITILSLLSILIVMIAFFTVFLFAFT